LRMRSQQGLLRAGKSRTPAGVFLPVRATLNTLTVREDVAAAGAGAMAAPADPRLKEETCFRNGSGAPPWWAP